eukprot:gene5264-8882_t
MNILLSAVIETDEPGPALSIVAIILEITDSVMFVSSLLQIVITLLILLFVLIFVRDTFNYLWATRFSLGLFVISWQVGIIFGLDYFWALWSRVGATIEQPVMNVFCGIYVILGYGIAEVGTTGVIASILGSNLKLDRPFKFSSNLYIMFILFFFIAIFSIYQSIVFILHIVFSNLGNVGFKFLYLCQQGGKCRLPLTSIIGSILYLFIFIILFNIFSIKTRRTIMNLKLSKRITMLQVVINIFILITILLRMLRVAFSTELFNLVPSIHVEVWNTISHVIFLFNVTTDTILCYIFLFIYVWLPLVEARANSKFRKQKHVMISPEPLIKKNAVNKFGVEHDHSVLEPKIEHENEGDHHVDIELQNISKRGSAVESGEITDRESGDKGQSSSSLLKNDSLIEQKEKEEEKRKIENTLVPEFEFEDELVLQKTPDQVMNTIKLAEKKLKPVLVQNPREQLKRKLEATKAVEKLSKKIKTSPKTSTEKLQNNSQNSQSNSVDIFDFDDEKPKKIRKSVKKDNSFFEDVSFHDEVFSKQQENIEHDELNEENNGIVRIIQNVNRKRLNSKQKQKEKKLHQKVTSESGKEILQRDNIVYYLDGLSDGQDMDEKCSSMSELAKFFSTHDSNVFLRAHGLISSVVSSLSDCNCENNEILELLSVQILCLIFKDSLNAEYISEKSYKKIHDCLENQYNSISNLSNSSQRSIRMRKTRVNIEEKDKKFYVTQSLVLEALYTILSTNEKANDLFVTFDTSRIIQNISQNLMLQIDISVEDNLKLLKDMKNCLHLIFDKNINLEIYIPTLLRLIQIIGNKYLTDFDVKTQVVDCLVVILKQLTNITNFNEDMCKIVAAESGLLILSEFLFEISLKESKKEFYDLNVLCLGLLINLTEKNQKNCEILGKLKISSNSQGDGRSILQFLIEIFLTHNTNENLEHNIILSYSGTLLGCLSKDKKNKEMIKKKLPNQSFDSIVLKHWIL